MRGGKANFAGGLFLLTFFGFDCLLFLVFAAGQSGRSQDFTVPYRMLAAGVALLWICFAMVRRRARLGGWPGLLLVVFLGAYLLRIVHDTLLVQAPLMYSPREYLLRFFGMLVIPLLAFGFSFSSAEIRSAARYLLVTAIVALALILVIYRKYLGDAYRMLTYSGIESDMLVSPLAISYMGAGALLMAVYYPFTRVRLVRSDRLLALLAGVLGIIGIYYGASRGALLASLAGMLPLGFNPVMRSKVKAHNRLLILALVVLAAAVVIGFNISSNLGGRMEVLLHAQGESAGGGRVGIWADTLAQFAGAPLTGSGLVEKISRAYPHNYFLEALMTTGVGGGLIFGILVVYGIVVALKRAGECTEYSWVAALFLMYFSQGMVSGSILDGKFWIALVATLMIPRRLPERPVGPAGRQKPHRGQAVPASNRRWKAPVAPPGSRNI